MFEFMPVVWKAVNVPLKDLDLMISGGGKRRETGHNVLERVLCCICVAVGRIRSFGGGGSDSSASSYP